MKDLLTNIDKPKFDITWMIAVLLFVSGCTGLGRIQEGQHLVKEYQLELNSEKYIQKPKELEASLAEEITKKPNGKLLWMRPGLALYNTIAEPDRDKGLKHWLKYKMGKQPVFLDEAYLDKLNATFENRLYHQGFFNAKSSYQIERHKKTASVIFNIETYRPYLVDTLMIDQTEDLLLEEITSLRSESLIKNGERYALENLTKEQIRIEKELKNRGFYYFDKNYVGFLVDTTNEDHRVKIKLDIKSTTPKEAHNIYSIGKISVAEDFRLQNYHPDTMLVDDYEIISATNYMKPKYFLNSVLYDSTSTFSYEVQDNSLKQLMGLNAYKFVNLHYTPSRLHDKTLNVTYLMTPSPKTSISTELNAVSKTNSFAGPGIRLTYNSKNFMRGAELLSVSLNGRFEKQIGGEMQGDTAYEISVDASLDIPRLVPLGMKKKNHPYLPTTSIFAGFGVFSRVSLYRFNTFKTGMGYTWRKNKFLTHALNPIDISVTDLADATPEFQEFLFLNPSIRKSFEEQFIIGSIYSITINKLSTEYPRRYYLNFAVDPSGNMIAALASLFNRNDNKAENTVTVFGQPVSQFSRGRIDFRYYFNTGKEAHIATRLYTGVGVPYGQSEVMPYVRQFYVGGTNSMRAFRARSLGPGSYNPPDSLENLLVDQTGDIKLEANIEYRFPIAGYLKGALFTDIGNIWLVNADTLRPGGKFNLSTFHKQLAAGFGFGLRVDVNLMVLRLDWAFPIRKPWLPEGERWIFDEIDVFDSAWRRENLLWNISIGYPF